MPRNPELTAYLTRFSGQDEVLARVERETRALPDAGMLSRPDQAALLTLLTRMLDARTAIEVGTFTGYGAICIARGLAPGGRLTCFEVSEEYAGIARRNLEAAGLSDRVTVALGPAAEALAALPDEPHVDLAYVDADKTGYPALLRRARAAPAPRRRARARQHAAAASACSTRRTSARAPWRRSTSGSRPTTVSSPCCSASPTA